MNVGDKVRLNRHGLSQIGGLQTPEQIEAHTAGVRITHMEPLDTRPPMLAVDLEPPFNIFLLTDQDVDPT